MVCSQHVSHLKVYERTVLMLNFEKKNILVKSLKLYSFCFCLVRWWIFTFNQNRYDGQFENTEGLYKWDPTISGSVGEHVRIHSSYMIWLGFFWRRVKWLCPHINKYKHQCHKKMERENGEKTCSRRLMITALHDKFGTLTKFHIYSEGSSECRAGIGKLRKIQANWTQVLSLDNGPANVDRSISADEGPLSCLMSTTPGRMQERTTVCASNWGRVTKAHRRDWPTSFRKRGKLLSTLHYPQCFLLQQFNF